MADIIRGSWEYKFASLSIDTDEDESFSVAQDRLNQLGLDGWEVVAAFPLENDAFFFVALLKRPVAKPI